MNFINIKETKSKSEFYVNLDKVILIKITEEPLLATLYVENDYYITTDPTVINELRIILLNKQ